MEGVMAVVTNFAADFAPKNWAYCNGQILPIAQNQALFSLLGTTYGGNGVNTFALPNLQSRTQVGVGQSTTGTNYTLGEMIGNETATLTINQMPSHTHNGTVNANLQGDNTNADQPIPDGNYPSLINNGYGAAQANVNMLPPSVMSVTVGISGSNQPFSLLSPYICINYIICMYGLFPSRN